MEDEANNKVNEPEVAYKPAGKKTITFYNSFEEMEEDRYRYLGSRSHEECLAHLEDFRKSMYNHSLLPNGSWPLLSRKLTIIKLPYEVR